MWVDEGDEAPTLMHQGWGVVTLIDPHLPTSHFFATHISPAGEIPPDSSFFRAIARANAHAAAHSASILSLQCGLRKAVPLLPVGL